MKRALWHRITAGLTGLFLLLSTILSVSMSSSSSPTVSEHTGSGQVSGQKIPGHNISGTLSPPKKIQKAHNCHHASPQPSFSSKCPFSLGIDNCGVVCAFTATLVLFTVTASFFSIEKTVQHNISLHSNRLEGLTRSVEITPPKYNQAISQKSMI